MTEMHPTSQTSSIAHFVPWVPSAAQRVTGPPDMGGISCDALHHRRPDFFGPGGRPEIQWSRQIVCFGHDQWIGLREDLQDNPIFFGNMVSVADFPYSIDMSLLGLILF